MEIITYRRHRFPPDIIQHAVRLYYRFTLSYRDVEDLLAERGIDVSYETVRRWAAKFGQHPLKSSYPHILTSTITSTFNDTSFRDQQ